MGGRVEVVRGTLSLPLSPSPQRVFLARSLCGVARRVRGSIGPRRSWLRIGTRPGGLGMVLQGMAGVGGVGEGQLLDVGGAGCLKKMFWRF